MLKSFRTHLHESPNETEAVVPVSVYLHREPVLMDVQHHIAAVREGRVSTKTIDVPLSVLIPTQSTVNNIKVVSYAKQELASDLPPLVMNAGLGFAIIDGHHRVCAEALNQKETIVVRLMEW